MFILQECFLIHVVQKHTTVTFQFVLHSSLTAALTYLTCIEFTRCLIVLVCHSPLPPTFPPYFPLSSAPAPLPDCFQSFLREEALDFFCSQCHKQISRLEDLSTRLNFLEMTR